MANFCKSCGGEVSDTQSFCTNCGAPIDKTEVVQSNDSNQNNNTNTNTTTNNGTYVQPKSKIVAGLLGIFLGGWGLHSFYLGYTSKGIIQIVVSIVTCGIGGLWGFIEGILILTGSINTDANGNALID